MVPVLQLLFMFWWERYVCVLPSDPSCNPRGEGHDDVIKCSDHSANHAALHSACDVLVVRKSIVSLCIPNYKLSCAVLYL